MHCDVFPVPFMLLASNFSLITVIVSCIVLCKSFF